MAIAGAKYETSEHAQYTPVHQVVRSELPVHFPRLEPLQYSCIAGSLKHRG